MKKILSVMVAALAAMSFSAMVFAADVVKPAEQGDPQATSAPADAAKDAKAAKAG